MDDPNVNIPWSNTVDLTSLSTQEECLPLIGSCQVSTILSNLSKNFQHDDISQMEVIFQDDAKHDNPQKAYIHSADLILFKDDVLNLSKCRAEEKEDSIKSDSLKEQKLTLIFCNLCPFFCLNPSRITEHTEIAHKNGAALRRTQYKCFVCPNIFYHKISLQTHLMYDHFVFKDDVETVMDTLDTIEIEEDINRTNYEVRLFNECQAEKCKDESSRNELCDTIIDSNTNEKNSETNSLQILENDEPPAVTSDATPTINLPTLDLTQNTAEKLFNDYIKEPDQNGKSSTKKPLHRCKLCKTKMLDPKKLDYHTSCHYEICFKCPECGEIFSFWKVLAGHLWRNHKINMELYSCDQCDYHSVSKTRLNNVHKLIHSDEKNFICDVCQKGFKNDKQLRNHKIMHKDKSAECTIVCEICSKKFVERRQLKVHMDGVHNKIKPYLCNYCGYKAATASALKMHIRRHTGEKPFQCDSCSYTTSDHNTLRRHKLRHSGKKPYKCNHCNYECIQTTSLKVHLKTRHPGSELIFCCQDCTFKTINKEVYISHISTDHKTE